MRPAKRITYTDLYLYGFVLDPVYNETTQTWTITRVTKKGLINQPIFKAISKHKYAPDSERLIINFCYKGKNYSLPLTRFLWCFLDKSHEVPEDYYVILVDEKKPYIKSNMKLINRKEYESHKNKGNQYYSEKWSIIAKKYES